MTQAEFIDAVLEQLFVKGFSDLNVPMLSMYVDLEWKRLQQAPDPGMFAEKCVGVLGIVNRDLNPMMGNHPSTTIGAREEWLAVHEAGHAIVGLKAGFTLRGVHFYGDYGFPGETSFEDIEWRTSTDESLLRRQIRVDVAGNIAEILHPTCVPRQCRLSTLYVAFQSKWHNRPLGLRNSLPRFQW